MSAHSRGRHARSWLSTLLAPRPSERPVPWLRIRLDRAFAVSYWVQTGRHWAEGEEQ